MKIIKCFVKNNYKVFVGIVIGTILTATGVYAATVIASSNVSYNNASSGLTATTVQAALDELQEDTKNITKYAFGDPASSSVTTYNNYMDLVNSGKKVFIALNNGDKTLCLYINGGLMCFENTKNKMSVVHQVGNAYYATTGSTGSNCGASANQYTFNFTCTNNDGAGESCSVSGSQTDNTPISISCTDSSGNKCALGTDDSVTCTSA